jgi:hypothetical protein
MYSTNNTQLGKNKVKFCPPPGRKRFRHFLFFPLWSKNTIKFHCILDYGLLLKRVYKLSSRKKRVKKMPPSPWKEKT